MMQCRWPLSLMDESLSATYRLGCLGLPVSLFLCLAMAIEYWFHQCICVVVFGSHALVLNSWLSRSKITLLNVSCCFKLKMRGWVFQRISRISTMKYRKKFKLVNQSIQNFNDLWQSNDPHYSQQRQCDPRHVFSQIIVFSNGFDQTNGIKNCAKNGN